jgi:Ca2+-binding RTX toxin-like protein
MHSTPNQQTIDHRKDTVMFGFFKNAGRKRSSKNGKSQASRHRRRTFESLENRQLFSVANIANGTLMIFGNDAADDRINVIQTADGTHALVSITNLTTGQAPYVAMFELDDFSKAKILSFGGNDTITYNLSKPSEIYGGAGLDVIAGGNGTDFIYGEGGEDTLKGGGGIDFLHGGTESDKLYGGAGNDTRLGEQGNDTYFFAGHSAGIDAVIEDSGAGIDTLDFSGLDSGIKKLDLNSTELQTVSLWNGENSLELLLSSGSVVENVVGTSYDDVIYGNNGANTLSGLAGDDELYGRDGIDSLYGGDGDDYLDGGDSDDHLYGERGNDIVVGNRGLDWVHFTGDVDLGHDTLPDWYEDGDILDFSSFSQGINLDLNVNTDTEQTVAGHLDLTIYHPWTVTHVIGTNKADVIDGNGRDNVILGMGDNDTLSGHGGNDRLYGDVGNDTLDGGSGHDWLYGDAGDDIIKGGSGDDHLFGAAGFDRLYGEGDDDTLSGGDDDIADLLVGGPGHDAFWAEWEYTYTLPQSKSTSSLLIPLLRWNRDKPADYDSGSDDIV